MDRICAALIKEWREEEISVRRETGQNVPRCCCSAFSYAHRAKHFIRVRSIHIPTRPRFSLWDTTLRLLVQVRAHVLEWAQVPALGVGASWFGCSFGLGSSHLRPSSMCIYMSWCEASKGQPNYNSLIFISGTTGQGPHVG